MGKTKQRPLATLLTIIALVIPGIAGMAQSNMCDSILDSGSSPCDLSQSLAGELMAVNDHEEGSVRSFSLTTVDRLRGAWENDADPSRSSQPPRWTVSAEAIAFERVGTTNWTLVEKVPGTTPFHDVPNMASTEALSSTDLYQGFSPGFRLGATYHIDSNYDLSLSFFRNSDWESTVSIGRDNPLNWLEMKAPGDFFQTQDFTYQSMTWDYSTELYNVEFNVQNKLSNRITLLAGFRWLQLNENLLGTIPPADRIQPLWKLNPNSTLNDVANFEQQPGFAAPDYPPFWDASTTNNLYGFQIGVDGKLFECGHFSLNGLIKAGGYWNNASESTWVSLEKVVYKSDASTNHATFVGEAGLQFKYQITDEMTLKFGYEVLWLAGVALAPGQIEQTYTISPATVYALGVNCNSDVLFHGVTAGLEYSF